MPCDHSIWSIWAKCAQMLLSLRKKGNEGVQTPYLRRLRSSRDCLPKFPWLDDRGYRTVEMNGGSSAPYLARTPGVPLFSILFQLLGVETEGLLDYQGRGVDHFHCTVQPSPGHIRCRGFLLLGIHLGNCAAPIGAFFCPEARVFTGFGARFLQPFPKVLSDCKVLFKHKNGR